MCLSLSFRLSLSEQNADRKCSCRNDSLRRRQTLTTTPSSPLHFRHRRRRRRCRCCRRHLGSRPRPRLSAPHPGPAAVAVGRRRRLTSTPSSSGRLWTSRALSTLRSGAGAAARPGRLALGFIFLEAARRRARVRWWSCAWGALRPGQARRPRRAAAGGHARRPGSSSLALRGRTAGKAA